MGRTVSRLFSKTARDSFDAIAESEVYMPTDLDILARRIAYRFLGCKRSHRSYQGRQAFFLNLPAPEPHIPDDIVLQCSSGCTLTAREVEQMLPKRLRVATGSCRIAPVPANAEANRTRFEVRTIDGKRVTGSITVNMLATERKVDAFTVLDLDT